MYLNAVSGLAYALGNLYRDKFVIPKSEVTGIMLAAFYLQFAELKDECVISAHTYKYEFTDPFLDPEGSQSATTVVVVTLSKNA